MLKRVVVSVFAAMLSMQALSGSPGTWAPSKTIGQLFIEGDDTNPRLTILTSSNIDPSYMPSDCQSTYLNVNLNTEKGKSLYSMLLAAKMANKMVAFVFTSCTGSRPNIHMMRLE